MSTPACVNSCDPGSPACEDPLLAAALLAMAPARARLGHRLIGPGDEAALLPGELPAFERSVVEVRRRSGAVRSVARSLAAQLGFHDIALPRGAARAAVWPPDLVGSLAHDDEVAVAAVAHARDFRTIGIDVEPPLPLQPRLAQRIATPRERARYPELSRSRLLFVIKEAVFKARFMLDGTRLALQEIESDLDNGSAITRSGLRLDIRFREGPRVLALAFLPRD